MFASPVGDALAYDPRLVPWKFNLRKEVFTPNEKLENPSSIDLIFNQVVKDCKAASHPRMTEEEQTELSQFLGMIKELVDMIFGSPS